MKPSRLVMLNMEACGVSVDGRCDSHISVELGQFRFSEKKSQIEGATQAHSIYGEYCISEIIRYT